MSAASKINFRRPNSIQVSTLIELETPGMPMVPAVAMLSKIAIHQLKSLA
jgi:hypothetical protein